MADQDGDSWVVDALVEDNRPRAKVWWKRLLEMVDPRFWWAKLLWPMVVRAVQNACECLVDWWAANW